MDMEAMALLICIVRKKDDLVQPFDAGYKI